MLTVLTELCAEISSAENTLQNTRYQVRAIPEAVKKNQNLIEIN